MQGLGWAKNSIDYYMRQAVRLRRGGVRLPSEAKNGLFDPESMPEVERIVSTYHLGRWQQTSGRVDFASSLAYVQMLELALSSAGVILPNRVRVLYAGAGDWFYVRALYGLLRYFGKERTVQLDGVELDAYALYEGFRSRYDWAAAYSAGLDGVRYIPGDVSEYTEPVEMAIMLFPFLFANHDMRLWGLPRRFLRPATLLTHVAGLVKPGGLLLIANVGDEERQEQHRLIDKAGLTVHWWARHDTLLWPSERPRFVTVVHR